MLDDNACRRLNGQNICTAVLLAVEVMVKTFLRCIQIHWVGCNLNKMKIINNSLKHT